MSSLTNIKRYLAQGGGDLLRLDSRGKGEPLLKLLRDEALTSLGLRLVLRQHYQHVPLRLDAQLLGKFGSVFIVVVNMIFRAPE